MSEKFENTIKKIGSTKYVVAPVDLIRSGRKPNGEMVEAKNVRGKFLLFFITLIILGIVAYLLFFL